ncbi:MAG: DUF3846 domain-containing protein [Paludibacteraceae bacterium]|nr:DUF3846 domain-containing protein [Paludibacteraceae bacterium]
MAVLIRTNGKKEEVKPKNGKNFSLEELRTSIGGGWIECLPIPSGMGTIVCDEEGKLKGLPMNEVATHFMYLCFGISSDYLCGDVLVADDGEID